MCGARDLFVFSIQSTPFKGRYIWRRARRVPLSHSLRVSAVPVVCGCAEASPHIQFEISAPQILDWPHLQLRFRHAELPNDVAAFSQDVDGVVGVGGALWPAVVRSVIRRS
jgi:hypothetical protein